MLNLSNIEKDLFHQGELYNAFKVLGSHLVYDSNAILIGANFCLYQPNAKAVRIIIEDNLTYPLEEVTTKGFWYAFISNIGEEANYKYEITTEDDTLIEIIDPYCFYQKGSYSKVFNIDNFNWNDDSFINRNIQEKPLIIYQIHLCSWKKYEVFSFSELVNDLLPYLKKHGFTHIELLSLIDYENRYFSVHNINPYELMYFIDCCHQENIGVLVNISLNDQDYGQNEVKSILISSSLFWLEYYHIDGIKLNNISEINDYQGIEFLRQLNTAIYDAKPNTLMIAETKSKLPLLTKALKEGGLGFKLISNLNWTNSILEYFEEKSLFRKYLFQNIIISLETSVSEINLLSLPYNEFTHKSLLSKMPGDYWQKFANYRLLIGLLMTHPGKKLLFMGCEFAHMSEWNEKAELDWRLYQYPPHEFVNRFVRDLIRIYKSEEALSGSITGKLNDNGLFSFVRQNKTNTLVIIINTNALNYNSYQMIVPYEGIYEEIINSDRDYYGGSNMVNISKLSTSKEKDDNYVEITIPPLGLIILKRLK